MIPRLLMVAGLAVSGVSHASLYAHGYREIPVIGPGFLIQASVFLAIAALLLVGGPDWLKWAAGALAVGALGAFALSRTVGIAGFTERGWDPAPHAALSVVAELVIIACAVGSHSWPNRRSASTRDS